MNAPSFPLPVADMREQVNAIQRLMEAVMKVGEHYGVIPGSRKPSLWKPGAEKLCVAFQIEASFAVEDLSTRDYYRYRVKCVGTHQQSGIKLGEGMGSCSSLEQKFKWRRASDGEYDNTPAKRRRLKYRFDRETLRPEEIKQVRAEQEDLENTILKMACKRAHVAMTLNVTAASDIFTQDIEDLPEHLRDEEVEPLGVQPRELKGPQRKSRKSARPRDGSKAKATKAAAPPPTEPSAPGGLSAGQLRILRARMGEAKVSDEDLAKEFGLALGALPASRFHEIAAWLREAGRAQS